MRKFILTTCLAFLSALALSVSAQTQQRNVKISVSDKEGPVIGAGVLIKGTNTGGVTDMNGVLELKGVTNSTVLSISCIGYASQEITVGNQQSIDVLLAYDMEELEGVVMVGYGVQKKESLTSAISQISAEDITNTKHTDAVMSLQGKVPGLLIREQSGKPGEFNTDLSLRGYGSPMIVVDGVVRSGSATRKNRSWGGGFTTFNDMSALQEINPEDIESISILKDASATIYGLGAANGVILITTKKGASRAPSVSYSATIRLTRPVTNYNVEDWGSFMKWDNAMSDNAKMTHRFSDEEIDQYYNDPNYVFYDWYEGYNKKFAVNQQHNVTVSGGSDKIRYYLGLGYVNENPIYHATNYGYQRYNVNGNVSADLTDNLTAKYTTGIRVSDTMTMPDFSQDWNLQYYLYAIDPRTEPTLRDDPTKYSDVNEHRNVFAMSSKDIFGYSQEYTTQFQNTLDLTYKAPFLKGLQLSATGAYDLRFNKTRDLVKMHNLYDFKTGAKAATVNNNSYSEMWTNNTRLYGRVQATYNGQFGKHSVDATLAAEVTNVKNAHATAARQYGATQASSFYTHDTLNSGLPSTASNSGTRTESLTAGYIGRVSYNYDARYFAEVMARLDGTYYYASGHRFGLFPSYSLGWRISEEQFFKNILPWINNLKFRWSDGKTGSVQGSPYAYIGGYSTSGSWIFSKGSTTTGYDSTIVENTILTWADVRMLDFGVDFEMKQGLLGASFDWFKRITSGIAATRSVSLPDFYGVALPQENINKSEHEGLEFSVYHRHHIGKFNYRVQASMTYYRNRQTYIESENTRLYSSAMDYYKNSTLNRWSNARSASRYEWTGGRFENLNQIASTTLLYDMSPNAGGNRELIPGMYELVDRDGDGYITSEDLFYRWPDNNPPLQFGLNISGSWKELDFSLSFSGASNKSKAVSLSGYSGYGYLYHLPKNFTEDCYHVATYGDDPWDPATKWVSGYWPALVRTTSAGASHNATYASNQPYNFVDATYLRLKTVEIGYRINADFLKKIHLKSARVYFNGGNLLTFCDRRLKFVDPESFDSGRQGGAFQINKSYSFGITLNF